MPENTSKSEHIGVRVTPATKEKLERLARADGCDISELLRGKVDELEQRHDRMVDVLAEATS